MTQASVLRTSSTGYEARRTTCGYQRVTLGSWRVMRSPICTRACWMWRGCFSSCRYSVSCLSESWRPNQVFHQNRNGIRTISHAGQQRTAAGCAWTCAAWRGLVCIGEAADCVDWQSRSSASQSKSLRRGERSRALRILTPPHPHPARGPAPDNGRRRTGPEAASAAGSRRRSIRLCRGPLSG